MLENVYFKYPPALICLCLFACSQTDESATTVTIVDSVREVVSHAPEPLPPPWNLIEELSIGVDYGDEDYMLRRPWALTVLDNGTIVILDSNPLQLRLYDSDGLSLTAFGEPGDGPGDLVFSGSNGTTMRPAGNNSFEILSNWPIRAQTWNVTGSLEDIQTMPDDHPFLQGRRPRIKWFIGSSLFGVVNDYQRLDSGETEVTTYLLLSDLVGTKYDTLFTFQSYSDMPPMAGMAQASMDYTPEDSYMMTKDGRIYYSKMTEDWIQVIDPESHKIIMRFHWQHEPDAIPESLIQKYTEQFGSSLAEGATWLREHVYMIYLAEGPDDEIWVQRTGEPDQDGLYPTDVFRDNGIYRGRLLLPFQPRLQFIKGRYLYAISSTEEGAPTLVRYRLEPAK